MDEFLCSCLVLSWTACLGLVYNLFPIISIRCGDDKTRGTVRSVSHCPYRGCPRSSRAVQAVPGLNQSRVA
jgi:hypothetical protein